MSFVNLSSAPAPVSFWKALIFIMVVTIVLAMCVQPSFAQETKLKKGQYTVAARSGIVTTFIELPGIEFLIISDTLKAGDKITVKPTGRKRKVNVTTAQELAYLSFPAFKGNQ